MGTCEYEPLRYLSTVVQPSPVVLLPLHNIKESTIAIGVECSKAVRRRERLGVLADAYQINIGGSCPTISINPPYFAQ